MPFDDYTLDPYSGGVTFRDSGTGEQLLTTPEAGMARMQEIDAQRAALMPGYVPETTGVAYSTELPPMVPPRMSLLGEGSMALAEAPRGNLVARPDVSATTAAKRLDYIGQRVNEALLGPPAGASVATPPAPAPAQAPAASMSPMDKAKIDRMRDGAGTIEVPAEAAAGGVLAQAAATPGAVPVAPAPGAVPVAPAPGAAAAPPRIVATPNAPAEPQRAPETPQMVDVGRQTTTTSTGGTERSSTSRREVQRALGMSPTMAAGIADAMYKQGVIGSEQADALAAGRLDQAGLNERQAAIYDIAAEDAAVLKARVDSDAIERYRKAEEYQRQAADMRADPNRLWKNASTGEKIQLGLAALLGAIGSGMKGEQQNMGVKIIEDAVRRDVDMQMQDIAAKRELATDTVRMAKLLMEQGATSRESADYIKNLQILGVTERAKSMAQRAGTWRAEDIDPATGYPKPGTRSFDANKSIIDAELRAKQFLGAWEAERAGTERVTAESAVKRATQTQQSVATTAQAAAPAGSELAGRGIFSIKNQDGKQEWYAVLNQEGMDAKEAVKQSQAVDKARGDLDHIDRLIKSMVNRKITDKELKSVIARANAAVAVMNGQGAMTDDERKAAEVGFLSANEATDVANSLRGFLDRAYANIKANTLGRQLTREQAEQIALTQRKDKK